MTLRKNFRYRGQPRRHATRLLALALAIVIVPQAFAEPGDIQDIAAPVLGADPPKAQDISDGDVSVSTMTGALTYSYPLTLPPGRAGMVPKLALTYSSQAPIYGGIAAGWQLDIPMITLDTSRGRLRYAHYAGNAEPEWEDEPFVSSLSGGRPLVKVASAPAQGVIGTYRAQNDSSWVDYQRLWSMPATPNVARWRAKTPDGVTHYFGEADHITNSTSVPTKDLTRVRAPLTTSTDSFGNSVSYWWTFQNDELRLAEVRYTENANAGVGYFAKVTFNYGAPTFCTAAGQSVGPIGAQSDYRTGLRLLHGAARLNQIVITANNPSPPQTVEHTRQIDLTYSSTTENCLASSITHSPFRQLSSIQERAWHTSADPVVLPPVSFSYGAATLTHGAPTPLAAWGTNEEYASNLGWGRRHKTGGWPTVEAMVIDMDGDGRLDRLVNTSLPNGNECQATWFRNTGSGPFVQMATITLPRLPWASGTKGVGERCALNHQRTMYSNVTFGPTCSPDHVGSYVTYRWMDMNGDGRPELVTAVQHDPHFDPSAAGAPTPTGQTWPSCAGDHFACRAVDHACMSAARTCPHGLACSVLPGAVEACLADAEPVACTDMTFQLTINPIINGVVRPTPAACQMSRTVGFQKCGQYPWTIYDNKPALAGDALIDLANPRTILQPEALESDSGDSSIGGGPVFGNQQAVLDFDGDGVMDILLRGRHGRDNPPPAGVSPWWWFGYLGDGSGGFLRDQVTGDHVARFFRVHEDLYLNKQHAHWQWTSQTNAQRFVDTTHQILDLNGDGAADYVRVLAPENPSSQVAVHMNDGLGMRWIDGATAGQDFILSQPAVGLPSQHFEATLVDGTFLELASAFVVRATRKARSRLIDVDEDGRPDLYRYVPGAPLLSFNVGGNLTDAAAPALNMRPGLVQAMDLNGALGDEESYLWQTKSDLIDLDGDGLPESVDMALQQRGVYNPAGAPPRLLTQVNNGRGMRTSVLYASVNDTSTVDNTPATVANPTSSSTPRTQWVVKSIQTADDFESSTGTTTYFYDDPVFNADEQGRYAFRGFKSVTTTGPRGNQTIQRYSFGGTTGAMANADWSGRLVETVTKLGSGNTTVQSIVRQSWIDKALFTGRIATHHPLSTRSYTCSTGQNENTCRTTPAGFTHKRSTWSPIASAGETLLFAESVSTTQDSEAFDDGDRKTSTQYELYTGGGAYRLRTIQTDSFQQVGGADQLYASTSTTWDTLRLVALEERSRLDAAGNVAVTQRTYDMQTGNVLTTRKPVQFDVTGPSEQVGYDARKLLPAFVDNELGHRHEMTYEYGTGATLLEQGPNVAACGGPCPAPDLPQREGRRTTVDGMGRPTRIDVTAPYPGFPTVYQWYAAERFTYTDAPSGATPASTLHQRRIEFDEDRWTSVRTDVDGHGRPIRTVEETGTTAPADAVTAYDYDVDGTVVAVSVPDPSANNAAQVTFTYTFDTLGRATGMRRPDAATLANQSGVDVIHDGLTETRREVSGTAGGQTSLTVTKEDPFGRLLTVCERVSPGAPTDLACTAANDALTTYSYSPRDEVKSIVDPEGVTTLLDHDFASRRVQITRGSRVWRYGYDKNGNLTSEAAPPPTQTTQDVLKWTTSYVYDALDRMTSKLIAVRGLSDADLDLFGAYSATYTWDGSSFNRVGRLASFNAKAKTASLPSVYTGTFWYDPEGQTRIEERGWTVPLGPTTALTIPPRREVYEYAPFGKINKVTNADAGNLDASGEAASIVSTDHNDRGTPLQLVLSRPGMTNQVVGVQTRNVAGVVTKRRSSQTGTGIMPWIESNWTYDKLGRVASHQVQKATSTQIARQDLLYWGNDDPKQLDQYLGASNHKRFAYTYDRRHQLTNVAETFAGGAFSSAYTFGRAGRFTHATVSPTALPGREARPRNVDYEYAGTDPEAVTALRTPTGGGNSTPYAEYEYDTVGNQTKRRYFTDASIPPVTTAAQEWQFFYDGEDQLRRAISPDGTIEEYWYDNDASRALVRTRAPSAPIKWRAFHGNTEIELKSDSLTDTSPDLVQTLAYASMGTPVARIQDRNDRTEFQFHGLASSTLATVESGLGVLESGESAPASGSTNTAFTYSPFGEVLEATGTEVASHRRRMNDKYQDASSGLGYYGFRYYDQVSMTWTQSDPLFRFTPEMAFDQPRRALLYMFSAANPNRYIDPDGRDITDGIDWDHYMRTGEYKFVPQPEIEAVWQEVTNRIPVIWALNRIVDAVEADDEPSVDLSNADPDELAAMMASGGSPGGAGGPGGRSGGATKPATIRENARKGKAGQDAYAADVGATGAKVDQEVTLRAKDKAGSKTRIDVISTKDRKISLAEVKTGNAQVSVRQKTAHKAIKKYGAVVVGKGKKHHRGGRKIPPGTHVKIIRKKEKKE